jgi:hypothetical protein
MIEDFISRNAQRMMLFSRTWGQFSAPLVSFSIINVQNFSYCMN